MRIFKSLFILLIFMLVGCNSYTDESDEIKDALSQYLSLLGAGSFEDAFEYITYYTDDPHTIEYSIAKEIWVNRVRDYLEMGYYLSSYSIQEVEHSKENQEFAQAKVMITFFEEGIEDTRYIYIHLEKLNDDWKVGSYFLEDLSNLDPITKIYDGHISQNELREFTN